ncbi:transporter substrate-binding domain-containing protein [Acidisphaera sp. L21]|uniref:transporter substrate-binding domain-containing protein n=1 Tax=Acidisphaera sp. L21 TaxID=1641851 RepID=UPI00131BADE6|nr:transporter substrate-binding domain-containing protein [Acidisphaera sp. L21]
MPKIIALGAAIALAIALPAQAADLAAVKAAGVLRVGTTGDYKPFTFRETDGNYRGADITMARQLATELGVKITFVPTVWASLNSDFAADKFDIAVGGVTILPAREKIAAFSTATMVDGKRPIVRCADKDRLNSIAAIDRTDVRVVVNPGASNEDFAHANFPHAKLTVFPDNVTIFDEIAAGREDVMVTDGIEVDHQALLHPQLCAAAVPAPFTKLQKAYMLPRDPAFVEAVDRWWAGQLASGAWTRALDVAQHEP